VTSRHVNVSRHDVTVTVLLPVKQKETEKETVSLFALLNFPAFASVITSF